MQGFYEARGTLDAERARRKARKEDKQNGRMRDPFEEGFAEVMGTSGNEDFSPYKNKMQVDENNTLQNMLKQVTIEKENFNLLGSMNNDIPLTTSVSKENTVEAQFSNGVHRMKIELLMNSDIVEEMEIPITIRENEEETIGRFYRSMDYRSLKRSNQAVLQDMAFTDEYGFRKIYVPEIDDYAYMVALGSAYTGEDNRGLVFLVELEDGRVFYAVAGDMKADVDTDPTNRYTVAGDIDENNTDVIEFIMDYDNEYACVIPEPSERFPNGKGVGVLNGVGVYGLSTTNNTTGYKPEEQVGIKRLVRLNMTILE